MLEQGIVLLRQRTVEDFSVDATADVQPDMLGVDAVVHPAREPDDDALARVHIGHDAYPGSFEGGMVEYVPDLVPGGLVDIVREDLAVPARGPGKLYCFHSFPCVFWMLYLPLVGTFHQGLQKY